VHDIARCVADRSGACRSLLPRPDVAVIGGTVVMANVIRTEAELQRRHGVGQHADSCDGCLMADTIRAMLPVYDAAVKWRHSHGEQIAYSLRGIRAAVDAAEGK